MDTRRAQLDELPEAAREQLSKLDEQFYAAQVDIDRLIVAYVLNNSAELMAS